MPLKYLPDSMSCASPPLRLNPGNPFLLYDHTLLATTDFSDGGSGYLTQARLIRKSFLEICLRA